ncbi:putative bifunctional diguanylate cyclase/phosphodiesterase [Actinoplanes sp. HUAS TT8]|uniref:putative bifunctional diguanylate cyclase/phosphodiesterase n=1 Tax=Actinoplanes sp. HUAS TT8 TaxID=3447453 RepID=UPI003F528B0A
MSADAAKSRQMTIIVVLAVAMAVGQAAALASASTRPWIFGGSLAMLDALGVVYSWRAGAYSPIGASPWRLIAVGRAVSLGSVVALAVDGLIGSSAWWVCGASLRLLMFVLLAAGVFTAGLIQVNGRARVALLAENVTVFAGGFLVIWYFALEPTAENERPSVSWIAGVGWPLGDMLLLAAAASVVLRGSVTRFAAPVTLYITGLALYCVADVTWFAVTAATHAGDVPVTMTGMVAASLLITAAPMLTVARAGQPAERRDRRPPAWATHLPAGAMLAGCLLVLSVAVLEGQVLPWGVLACGLAVMLSAASLRQLLSLRDSWDQAVTEPVTGLVNRAGLDAALERRARQGESAALLLIDLDGFNLVNKAYGHAAGDEFLRHVGRDLRSTVRKGNVCARIGGDEFAVLLVDVTRIEDAAAVADRVLASLAEHPGLIEGDLVPVRASAGVAFAAADYDSKTLLRHADVALYESKRAGRHGSTNYEPAMPDRRAADAALADDLEHALHRGQLHLLYQPLVDLATERPVAAEALLRWQHPARGPISPVEFIPIAERTGAIVGIGLWVLEQALTQLTAGPATLYISVNLSPRQLREPTIVYDVKTALAQAGVDPHRLVLEVTESSLVNETGGIAALRTLREHGVRIALDDFGTGYSSLQYLTRLPVDILKIDRSFVAELDETQEGAAVTEAIIRLAQVLHLSIVAEGVETEQQARELRELGCEIGQGYLYARPLTPEDFARYTADARAA